MSLWHRLQQFVGRWSVTGSEGLQTLAEEVCESSQPESYQAQDLHIFSPGGVQRFSNASEYAHYLGLTYYRQTAEARGQIVRAYTDFDPENEVTNVHDPGVVATRLADFVLPEAVLLTRFFEGVRRFEINTLSLLSPDDLDQLWSEALNCNFAATPPHQQTWHLNPDFLPQEEGWEEEGEEEEEEDEEVEQEEDEQSSSDSYAPPQNACFSFSKKYGDCKDCLPKSPCAKGFVHICHNCGGAHKAGGSADDCPNRDFVTKYQILHAGTRNRRKRKNKRLRMSEKEQKKTEKKGGKKKGDDDAAAKGGGGYGAPKTARGEKKKEEKGGKGGKDPWQAPKGDPWTGKKAQGRPPPERGQQAWNGYTAGEEGGWGSGSWDAPPGGDAWGAPPASTQSGAMEVYKPPPGLTDVIPQELLGVVAELWKNVPAPTAKMIQDKMLEDHYQKHGPPESPEAMTRQNWIGGPQYEDQDEADQEEEGEEGEGEAVAQSDDLPPPPKRGPPPEPPKKKKQASFKKKDDPEPEEDPDAWKRDPVWGFWISKEEHEEGMICKVCGSTEGKMVPILNFSRKSPYGADKTFVTCKKERCKEQLQSRVDAEQMAIETYGISYGIKESGSEWKNRCWEDDEQDSGWNVVMHRLHKCKLEIEAYLEDAGFDPDWKPKQFQ